MKVEQTVYISPELRMRLRVAAAESDQTISEIVGNAIVAWLVRMNVKPKKRAHKGRNRTNVRKQQTRS